ncbi:thiol-disulfide oxidoreductase DCC family protein [Aquimarina hainanensis]|uniref:Thiol-disulfide oxidoreductase DCC family protein n=1 Tax=Aquimarina hainanensis TaxID=1578017 RepID=A0ABW5NES2_9FLAO|nr:DUF393 domain-containing protein [Aquimarina sp. TRL1]QKX06815.1 DUF393 domain-containing protein [Aquimarina sp. TRL1]
MNSNSRTEINTKKSKKVIFFDGVCNLCNGFIDFVIVRDLQKRIYYCSLQSVTAKEIVAHKEQLINHPFSTIYYYDQDQLYSKSTAILKILQELPKYRFISSVLLYIPPVIRDRCYHLIAKNRYFFLGKKNTCRIPSVKEQSQFLY